MNKRIELTTCPKCGATCKIGHDDDFQVFCACCSASFRPKTTQKVERAEYEEIKKKATYRYHTNGWAAFK